MRIVNTSGGLEWNATNDIAFVDAIPMRPRTNNPLSLAVVDGAVKELMIWQPWTLEMSPHANLRNYAGVWGINRELQLCVRFLWKREHNPIDAMQAIEAAENAHTVQLTPAIVGACLAATFLPPTNGQEDTAAANNMVAAFFAGLCAQDEVGRQTGRPWSRRDIERCEKQYLANLAAGSEVAVPPSAVARARFWLQMANSLWQSDTLTKLARVQDFNRLHLLNDLAQICLLLKPHTTFRAGNMDVTPPRLTKASPWAEALAWTQYAIPGAAVRFFAGFRCTDDSCLLHTKLPTVDAHQADAAASALLAEAQRRQVYLTTGDFVLSLPGHLLWHQIGAVALAIHAEPAGLWCAALSKRTERSLSWFWSPEMPATGMFNHTVGNNAWPLIHATLAAFWHDLVIAGDEVIVRVNQPATGNSQPARMHLPAAKTAPPTITLPRRSIRIEGTRTWSDAADHETTERTVRHIKRLLGFPRRLHEGWKRSEEIQHFLDDHGLLIADGYTYVRPVAANETAAGDIRRQPIVARARGLQALSILLDATQE